MDYLPGESFSVFVCNYPTGTVSQYCIFDYYHYVICLLSVESWIFPTRFLVLKTYAIKKKRQINVIQSNACLPVLLKLLIQQGPAAFVNLVA